MLIISALRAEMRSDRAGGTKAGEMAWRSSGRFLSQQPALLLKFRCAIAPLNCADGAEFSKS